MAVVRVKRHCDDEPIETLLLTCKRRKTEEEHLTSIFKFATTLTNQEENVSKQISKVFKSLDTKSIYKSPNITNITDKLRAENKLFSQNSRLKVVNCFRALSEPDSLEDGEGTSINSEGLTIVEIESLPSTSISDASKTSTGTPLQADLDKESEKYVYDIYYAPDCQLDEKMLVNPISCHVLDDLVFEDYADEKYDVEEYSDDSNDENNWRNDYPDQDPDSIGEDDMKLACQMGDLNISETNSLSSDGGEEELVYGVDEPDYNHAGIDPADVDYYGYDYAAFKKRVTKNSGSDASENSDFFYCDSDAESDKV